MAVERVELHGVLHEVPPPWRGNRIKEVADPASLVRLPAAIAGELGIYVIPAARDALLKMAAEAAESQVVLQVDSGFRSFGFQKRILEGRLADGRSFLEATRWTAPPGDAGHMSGRVVDFVPRDATFKDAAAYDWLRQHAARFCFSESYPLGNEGGFEWEPWHWRFDDCDGTAEEALPEGEM